MSTMSSSERYVILAPHVDDEIIGCYRLISAGLVDEVVYFFEVTKAREAEARRCAKDFDYKAVSYDNSDELVARIAPTDVTVLMPHIKDLHPHHKLVNLIGRQLPNKKKFYTVDMTTDVDVLPQGQQMDKRQTLLNYFPSQSELFLKDDKYWLFEGLHSTDVISSVTSKGIWGIIHVIATVWGTDTNSFNTHIWNKMLRDVKDLQPSYKYTSSIGEQVGPIFLEHLVSQFPGKNCQVVVRALGADLTCHRYEYR